MEQYKLSLDFNKAIVNGVMRGYDNYLKERKRAAKTYRIHNAFAWIKGNLIDDSVATLCEPLGFECKVANAGVAWKYLQFEHQGEKVLFLIKNARYFNIEAVNKGKDIKGNTKKSKTHYMEPLININTRIKFPIIKQTNSNLNPNHQLQLFDLDDYEHISEESIKDYKRFYILTYSIDTNHMISEVNLWMPNPINNKAYQVEDLSHLLGTEMWHTEEIEDDLKEILSHDLPQYSASEYGIMPVVEIEKDSTGK